MATINAIDAAASLRATNAIASTEGWSAHWTSSTKHSSGALAWAIAFAVLFVTAAAAGSGVPPLLRWFAGTCETGAPV